MVCVARLSLFVDSAECETSIGAMVLRCATPAHRLHTPALASVSLRACFTPSLFQTRSSALAPLCQSPSRRFSRYRWHNAISVMRWSSSQRGDGRMGPLIKLRGCMHAMHAGNAGQACITALPDLLLILYSFCPCTAPWLNRLAPQQSSSATTEEIPPHACNNIDKGLTRGTGRQGVRTKPMHACNVQGQRGF